MRKRIGDLLVDSGIIDGETLKDALAEAARGGRRLGEILLTNGYCTEDDIIRALSDQHRIPVAPLGGMASIPSEVQDLIPRSVAISRQVLPLRMEDEVLVVAIADPSSFDLVDELRFVTGHPIRPMVAGIEELRLAIDRLYPEDDQTFTPTSDDPENETEALRREVERLSARVEDLTRRLDDAAAAHHALLDALENSGVLRAPTLPPEASSEG
ncbi:MAG: hypothetical protein ACE366_21625 [Bradymonadia bacterium]